MWQEEEDVVDRRWAIDWDAALAPPLAMIPDLSVFVSPSFDDTPVGADLSRPHISRPSDYTDRPEWESALNACGGGIDDAQIGLDAINPIPTGVINAAATSDGVALGYVEEEKAAAFQRDSLHL